jgi:hypothetical protein
MDKKISDLNVATALTGTEVLPIVQGGETKKVTAKAISELGGAVSIGQVAFGTAAGVIGGDAGLFWDNVNKRLGVGTSTPTQRLSVNGSINLLSPTSYIFSHTGNLMIGQDSFANYLFAGINAANTPPRLFIGRMNTSIEFQTNGGQERMRIASGGNVLIGTTTDSGARLHVQAQGALSTDIGFRVRNSADTADLLSARGNGNIGINTTTDAGFKLDVNGTARVQSSVVLSNNGIYKFGPPAGLYATTDNGLTSNSGAGHLFLGYYNAGDTAYIGTTVTLGRLSNVSLSATANLQEMVRVTGNFAPTSGTALFNALQLTPTINQTGGANGITRGLFVNPTLTAAADFRAIETARGNVVFGNLPTSPVGLPTGAIWNNLGILTIV